MALTPDPHANFLLAEMSDQLDFDFSNSATDLPGFSVRESGLANWREERRAAQEALAAKMGLPLGKRVRVEFTNGPDLEGTLLLDQQMLFLPEKRRGQLTLRIDSASFQANEISACIRLD